MEEPDEILLQVFSSNLDDMSKDARTAGRLITWREANETHAPPNSFNNSEFASSSHLAKLFDEILLQVFSNDPKHLSKEDARAADELVTWRDTSENVYTESLPCRELLSFLQKNIIIAAAAVAAILLVTILVVLALVTYIRRKKASRVRVGWGSRQRLCGQTVTCEVGHRRARGNR
ncbi:uncharacterized protein C2orf92 homolog [Microtus ochrogaster]|uniref:Uncharacterized protein C2orf92 homolog n=1 Tax=Microtus ochrogaster TaxID=79684 RepID=A0ABM1UHE8_MICOH|nr:uncharacterized protein C2orf92 homolog [Microtus ochrogaster]